MPEESEKTSPADAVPQEEQEMPLDTRLLSEAVIELNISRKNVGIYPPGHVQIAKSIERAYVVLERLLAMRPEMTLGVAKDTLLVGKDYLDRKNPVYRDFALSLGQQEIASITFQRGLDQEELLRFNRIVTTNPAEVRAAGGVRTLMAEAGIPHIIVKTIDYGAFTVTEEEEVRASGSKEEAAGLWQDFVSGLSGETLARPGEEGVSPAELEQIDPLELARLLNERKLDPSLAVESYDKIISTYVRAAAEKKQLTREQSETLRGLNSLMQDLNPDLRKQFLGVAFRRTSDASSAATEEVIGGFSDDMVLDMLRQANTEGREISPTLTGLLQKMTSVTDGAATEAGTAPAKERPAATEEAMRNLFSREQYENFVGGDYAETLQRLTESPPLVAAPDAEAFPIEEYRESMQDDRLDAQIGRVLLAFIDEDLDQDDYGEFLKKVVAVLPDLEQTGNFSMLHDVFETLRLHSREKKDPAIRSMAAISLRVFDDPAFLAKLVDAFATCGRDKVRAATGLLLALGDRVMPLVFDLFAEDDTPGGRRQVFDLLCRYGNAAVAEAARRLRDPRPASVRNLVMLIRWGWDSSVMPQVRPLLQHRDEDVRFEALTALLRFRDPAAAAALRDFIQSNDPDVTSRAVKLAGQFRTTAVVDALLGKLKKVILFETDYLINEEIIWALGQIGSPAAIPELEKLARAAWTIFPKRLARMKALLFESLDRYPRGTIAGLLAIGERTDNERIKRACRKLRGRS